MWELDEIAELFRVGRRTIRDWIIRDKLIEYRLRRVNQWIVKPVVTTNEVMKLLNLKRPVFGAGSDIERIYIDGRAKKKHAWAAGIEARKKAKKG